MCVVLMISHHVVSIEGGGEISGNFKMMLITVPSNMTKLVSCCLDCF